MLYANSILFVAPINILIYNVIDFYFGIIFNISSGFLFILGVYFHYKIIIARQSYNPIIKNDSFMTDVIGRMLIYFGNEENKDNIKRRIYEKEE